MAKQEVMPAGSKSPNADKATEQTETKADTSKQDDTKPAEKLLGKFESPEELAKSYTELEQLAGRQKSELGDLRTKVAQADEEKTAMEEANPPQDFVGAKALIERRIEDGEMSVAEGLTQLSALTQQESETRMEEKFAAYDSERTANDQYSQFIGSNPDFLEIEESGQLAEKMRTNPMHDKFSAFHEVKADMRETAAYEKGKEEALKIAKGADGTRSVLAKPGGSSRDVAAPQKGMNEGDKVSGMMSALQAARGQ